MHRIAPQDSLQEWHDHLVARGNPQHTAPSYDDRAALALPALLVVRVVDMRICLVCPRLFPEHKRRNGLEIAGLEPKIWDGSVSHSSGVTVTVAIIPVANCDATRTKARTATALDMDAQLQFGAADPSITYHQGWDAGIATQQGAVADIAFNGEYNLSS